MRSPDGTAFPERPLQKSLVMNSRLETEARCRLHHQFEQELCEFLKGSEEEFEGAKSKSNLKRHALPIYSLSNN